MSWLVLNTGSSSLKFGLFDEDATTALVHGSINWQGEQASMKVQVGERPEEQRDCAASDPAGAATAAIQAIFDAYPDKATIRGVGHRIVHGGTKFQSSVRIDAAVKQDITDLTELAPLHNPSALKGLTAAQQALPDVPHVAVFDTAFFKDLPPEAVNLPVPWKWTEEYGIRRYGFHGISHAYCAGKAAEILDRDPKSLRLVICHLGNGCSASAVGHGLPVQTSMSFTPLDGLMMGTRSGSIDPSIPLYLMQSKSLSRDAIENALNHDSGLLGVSGISGDYRQVEQAAESGNDRARLALAIYINRVRAEIGALAATLGGIDALVFAAGVGENSASLRASVCSGLEFMGIHLDRSLNDGKPVDTNIAFPAANVAILVIHTREELTIAREVRQVVGSG